MKMENQIKQAALKAMLCRAMKNNRPAADRSARNLIEMCCRMKHLSLGESVQSQLTRQLSQKLSQEEADPILQWLLRIFYLDS